ncbi:hypothetical protein [Thalassobacillus hwangdonensis]|uniref:Deacetylase PdaC domain-containing protein n=1 Tax=Thalassobacillus hwangdonensis TaxID=546108 RepID=A0ABW3L3J4_9BACI
MKKILKIIGSVIIGIIALLFLIGMMMPGDVDVVGADPDHPDNLSLMMDTYITDENYEPEEKEFVRHTMAALNKIDSHEWGRLDEYFTSEAVMETNLREVYMNKEVDPDEIDEIQYEVTNKQFAAFLNEEQVRPIGMNEANGVEWYVFPYDVWVEFKFELERYIKTDDGETYTDKFEVAGNYPPTWRADIQETHWALGALMLREMND